MLFDSTHMKFIESEATLVDARGRERVVEWGGRKNGDLMFNGDRVLV